MNKIKNSVDGFCRWLDEAKVLANKWKYRLKTNIHTEAKKAEKYNKGQRFSEKYMWDKEMKC